MARPTRIEQLVEPQLDLCQESVIHLESVLHVRASLPTSNVVDSVARVFAALSDPTRLRMVAALATSELCVCDLAATIAISESAVSHQLRLLRSLGLVRSRREGRLVYYALDDDHVTSLYRQALDHIDHKSTDGTA